MLLSKPVQFSYAQRAVPCNVCEDEVPGEYYCIECKQTLCAQCEKNHKRVAATKSHTIILRTQVGDIDTTILTCTDHGDQASFHCDKCNIPVCIKCVTGNHQGHKMVDFTERTEKEKKLLQDDINKIKSHVLPELKTTREEIKIKREKYNTKMKQIGKDMEDEHHARLEYLTRIHDDRLKNLGAIRVANLAKFDSHSKEINLKVNLCEDVLSKFEDANTKKNFGAIMNLTKMQMSLHEIGRTIHLPEPPSFEPGNIHSIDAILGKLNVKSFSSASMPSKPTAITVVSWFKSPLKGSTSVCITKEGDVWLGGDESRELVMVDIKGQVLRRRSIQNRPYSLAVMDCDDIIISPRIADSRSVSRILRDGRERHLFDASAFGSYGVSVTPEQNILICTFDGRVVRINGDGTNVKQIYEGFGIYSAIQAVEKMDGNIYIIDGTMRAVQMMSKNGNILSTITHTAGGQIIGPVGLVVDKMNNILCADMQNNSVHIIDQNQQMGELIGPLHGILSPRWLAVDKNNNLWITHDDGTVHVVNY